MKKRIFAALLALCLTVLTGCDWSDNTDDIFGTLTDYYNVENKDKDKDVKLTSFALPYLKGETADPITCPDGAQLTLGTLLYEGLFALDGQFEAQPALAESYTYDASRYTYTITLRAASFSDGTSVTARDVVNALRRAQNDLEALVAGFSRGRLLKLGVPTVLLGKPNAGKSSLLNALLGYDRAIVTDIAGTTRDTVEEKVTVGGVLLRLIDTAGIRDGGDAVETMGVERSRAAAKQASLALLVLDGSRELTAEDEAAIALANTVPHLIVAVNKSDLPRALDVGALADRFDNVLSVSAATGAGLDTLTDAIAAQFPAGESTGGALLTNARQADAANRALSAVAEARGALRIGMTPDVVLTDCEAALAALGELNGKQVRDDLVDTIFSRFCVGK